MKNEHLCRMRTAKAEIRISAQAFHFGHRKGKRKVQGVPQSQAAVFPRHQEEEETDKTEQAQIEQTYEKH